MTKIMGAEPRKQKKRERGHFPQDKGQKFPRKAQERPLQLPRGCLLGVGTLVEEDFDKTGT